MPANVLHTHTLHRVQNTNKINSICDLLFLFRFSKLYIVNAVRELYGLGDAEWIHGCVPLEIRRAAPIQYFSAFFSILFHFSVAQR